MSKHTQQQSASAGETQSHCIVHLGKGMASTVRHSEQQEITPVNKRIHQNSSRGKASTLRRPHS
eukprot:180079-Chlamydomonas_euryale.AAC.5